MTRRIRYLFNLAGRIGTRFHLALDQAKQLQQKNRLSVFFMIMLIMFRTAYRTTR